MAELDDSDVADGNSSESKLSLRYTLTEEMCALEVSRLLAVREGLLKVLVHWMKSKDREKIRPAATSLRDLTSTQDKYMAGWIHSQIVNERALGEIVELTVPESVGHDVRLAVAEILSSLGLAPHTRAAVVEAQCINYLIPLLYDHPDSSSQQVAYAAGTALLQLAAGALTRASVYNSDGGGDINEAVSPDKRDKVISDIVHGGAIGPLVQMATTTDRGNLRAMSIMALRVISEDTNQVYFSFGCAEDEPAVQVAGKGPNLLGDWFCLATIFVCPSSGKPCNQTLACKNLERCSRGSKEEWHVGRAQACSRGIRLIKHFIF